jgi:hypothetical protein
VLDKDAFLKINQKLLENVFYRLEDVKYTWNHGPDLKICNNKFSSPSEFIKKYYREVFFKKDVDWSNEGEIRLLLETPQIYLNIKGAIKHIVLGKRLIADESNMRKLLSLILSSDLRNYFSLHSFAYVHSSLGGYITEDASHHIQIYLDEIIKEGEETTYFIEK